MIVLSASIKEDFDELDPDRPPVSVHTILTPAFNIAMWVAVGTHRFQLPNIRPILQLLCIGYPEQSWDPNNRGLDISNLI
jgi:hypothetical protein